MPHITQTKGADSEPSYWIESGKQDQINLKPKSGKLMEQI